MRAEIYTYSTTRLVRTTAAVIVERFSFVVGTRSDCHSTCFYHVVSVPHVASKSHVNTVSDKKEEPALR